MNLWPLGFGGAITSKINKIFDAASAFAVQPLPRKFSAEFFFYKLMLRIQFGKYAFVFHLVPSINIKFNCAAFLHGNKIKSQSSNPGSSRS